MKARTLLLTCLAAVPALAEAATVITFEELPAGTVLTNQYGAKGVSFEGAYVYKTPIAHSGDRVILSDNPTVEFEPGQLVIHFASGQRYVKIFAGAEATQPALATFTAFDASGAVVGQDGPRNLPVGPITGSMQVVASGPVIRRVTLKYPGTWFETIDDLEFDGEPPPPVPTTPPVVEISVPLPGQLVGQPTAPVRGTVRGRQLAARAVVKTQLRRPPGSTTTSVYTYPVTLTGSGNVRNFATTVNVGLGPTAITVEAENAAGLRGQAASSVEYLPAAIRSRFDAENGPATFGSFVFGLENPSCAYAVWANAAVAAVSGTTRIVRGPILAKWLAKKDQGGFPELGCPTTDARAVDFGGEAQDFTGGRLYTHADGTYFVPPVFAAAIDALGGEAGTGLPISDPTSDSRPVFSTWLFQQFRRRGIELPSTLEIRGDPPRLFVERQAGDGSLFEGHIRPYNPTIVQSFDCTSTSVCPVVPPPDEPLFADAPRFCNGETFNWPEFLAHALAGSLSSYTPDPPEWVPIRGNYTQTAIWGAITRSDRATGDNPWAHEHEFEPCPRPALEALVNETICPSDWNIYLRPLPGFRSLQAASYGRVKVEFEQVHGQHYLTTYDEPLPGELLFASGRYIVDCGHEPLKTEIHPPSVVASLRTVTHNGRPATEADIWVNAFFPGGDGPGDAVEFDVYPPPRPSPSSTFGFLYPAEPGLRVEVTFTNRGQYGPVRVRVTAPRREQPVDKLGQMKWPGTPTIPGGFEGRLLVYWR